MSAKKRKYAAIDDDENIEFICRGQQSFVLTKLLWQHIPWVTDMLDASTLDPRIISVDDDPVVFNEMLNVIKYGRHPSLTNDRYKDILCTLHYYGVDIPKIDIVVEPVGETKVAGKDGTLYSKMYMVFGICKKTFESLQSYACVETNYDGVVTLDGYRIDSISESTLMRKIYNLHKNKYLVII